MRSPMPAIPACGSSSKGFYPVRRIRRGHGVYHKTFRWGGRMYDYRKQLAWSKLKVGIVVTGALIILLFAILFAGNIQNLFAPQSTIYATFRGVKGLRSGAPVWFTGVQIGSVKSISFTGDMITAAMKIDRDALAYLKKDSEASILTLGLLGDKYIEVSAGSKESGGLKHKDTIMGAT